MKIERWAGGIAFLLVVGLGLAALGAGSIVAWEYSNSDAFCTNACHAVHPEEPRAHEVSAHARVQCVECHIGRVSTLKAMARPAERKVLPVPPFPPPIAQMGLGSFEYSDMGSTVFHPEKKMLF